MRSEATSSDGLEAKDNVHINGGVSAEGELGTGRGKEPGAVMLSLHSSVGTLRLPRGHEHA
eukprot:7093881-Alexandrium_andersonii.AAC.1